MVLILQALGISPQQLDTCDSTLLDNRAAHGELEAENMDERHVKIQGKGSTGCQAFHSLLVEIFDTFSYHNLDASAY